MLNEIHFPIPSVEELRQQGLTLWQAGEFIRVMQISRSLEADGDYRQASEFRGLAINAGNLRDFEPLR